MSRVGAEMWQPVMLKSFLLSPCRIIRCGEEYVRGPKQYLHNFNQSELFAAGVAVVMGARPWLVCPPKLLSSLCLLLAAGKERSPGQPHEHGHTYSGMKAACSGYTWRIFMHATDMEGVLQQGSEEAVAVMRDALDAGLLEPLPRVSFFSGL